MNKHVELPIYEPIFKTYQFQGSGAALVDENDSIRNWYLNESILLKCSRDFLSGFGSLEIGVVNSSLYVNPFIEKYKFSIQHLNISINQMIRNFIDLGYYVYFLGVDDFYIKEKSLYKKKHLYHDGLICGYDKKDKTYCIYAYDNKWVYRKFWTPQICFINGCKSSIKNDVDIDLFVLKPKKQNVGLSIDRIYQNLVKYMDSSLLKYPFDGKGDVYGIVVHSYIVEYILKLHRGEIQYEFADWRILRLIWEHKKVMLERIVKIEQILSLDSTLSEKYGKIVKIADNIRMIYASYCMKRRDSLLSIISKKLLTIETKEREILTQLLQVMKKEIENETLELSEK